MKHARDVMTCTRCRQSKRQCDKVKPSCTRCKRGGAQCIYEGDQNSRKDKHRRTVHDEGQDGYPTPATTPPTPAPIVRKRNRACLSCTRCHRLKVKCDQKEPCARCLRSGMQSACTYAHRPKTFSQALEPPKQQKHQDVPFAMPEDDSELVVATWFLRKRGSTHYRAILNRVCLPVCTGNANFLIRHNFRLTQLDGDAVQSSHDSFCNCCEASYGVTLL